MVNKGSFFQRLRERWGSGSGVRIDRGGAAPRSAEVPPRTVDPRTGAGLGPAPKPASTKPVSTAVPQAASAPAAPPVTPQAPVRVAAEPEPAPAVAQPLAADFAPAELRSSRKLSEREEALLAIGGHFQELTAALRSSQARQDEQLGRLLTAAQALGSLPALSEQQLAVLQALSGHMERQHALGERLSSTLGTLPALLQNVETALARAAATDERTAATVREFQATMDRIHGAMQQMVLHSDTQAEAARQLAARRDEELQQVSEQIGLGLAATQQAQQDAVRTLQRTTDDGLAALRRSNEDQSNRLQRVVQEHAGWNRAVLVGLGLVGLGIVALLVLQLLK